MRVQIFLKPKTDIEKKACNILKYKKRKKAKFILKALVHYTHFYEIDKKNIEKLIWENNLLKDILQEKEKELNLLLQKDHLLASTNVETNIEKIEKNCDSEVQNVESKDVKSSIDTYIKKTSEKRVEDNTESDSVSESLEIDDGLDTFLSSLN